jgi:transcriptional regulator with XRE-family HTH domain
MHKFGSLVRLKREENEMLLRHLAAKLDVDTALLSKIERGERIAKRHHVESLIEILKLDKENAKTLWLADQLYAMISEEDEAIKALHVAEEQVKYNRTKK